MTNLFITSKSGLPCVWEAGGGLSSTGNALCIADSNGLPKKAIYVRGKGELACSNHALIHIEIGDILVDASHWRRDFTIEIIKIKSIEKSESRFYYDVLNRFDNGEWDSPLPEYLESVVQAAKDKATDYHCRTPYYIIEVA